MKQTDETMLGLGLQALSEMIEFLDLNGYGKGSKAVADARKTRDDIQAWLQRRKLIAVIQTAPENDDYYEADFPEWALCALVNGDHLEDKDDEMTFAIWLDRMISEGYDMLSPEVTEDRNEFCSVPEFGLATSTVKVRFRKRKEIMNQ